LESLIFVLAATGKKMSARKKGQWFAGGSWILGGVVFCLSFSIIFGQLVDAAPKDPKTFASPEEAAQAIFEAAKQEDAKGLSALFGPEGKDLISTGDKVADKRRVRFIKDYEEKPSWCEGKPRDPCRRQEEWPFRPYVKAVGPGI
jgi:hypothetical protein